MSCGEGIPADATRCAHCGLDFARQEPAPPSDDDPGTVAMFEVEQAPDPAPFVSSKLTVPLSPTDTPERDDLPPDSMSDGPGTLMMEHEPAPEPNAAPAHDRAPDSGTQVMADAVPTSPSEPAPRSVPPPPQPARNRRADPYAKTVIGAQHQSAEPVAFRPVVIARDPAPEPYYAPPLARDDTPERAAPQHYSIPPGANLEPLPRTGEFSQHELPEMAQPPGGPFDSQEALLAPPPSTTSARGEAAMSMVAGTAKIISEAFNSGFGQSLPGWRTEVAAPAGLSTEGGKQALMPITLVNAQAQRVAIGHADAASRRVTLKTHRSITRGYARRYNRGWDVSPEQYAALLETISSFFVAMQFEFATEDRLSSYPPPPAPPGQQQGPWLLLGIVALVLTLIVLLVYAWVR